MTESKPRKNAVLSMRVNRDTLKRLETLAEDKSARLGTRISKAQVVEMLIGEAWMRREAEAK